MEQLKAIRLGDLADPLGCQVYLWTTQSTLPLGLELFKAWGVRYHCTLTWIKHVGMTPYSFMFSTEHVLFGRIGRAAPLREMGIRLEFYARATGHSRKPEAFFQLIERVSDEPRLEMFARTKRAGWDAWGNEVDSDIALVLE
jgi:N6-adenosine-specific RNA methylase IME4